MRFGDESVRKPASENALQTKEGHPYRNLSRLPSPLIYRIIWHPNICTLAWNHRIITRQQVLELQVKVWQAIVLAVEHSQLQMRRLNLQDLPKCVLPDGYAIRTYLPGDELAWAAIVNTGIGEKHSAESCRTNIVERDQFDPAGLFFAIRDDIPVGTACAWKANSEEKITGYVHMVCVVPKSRGIGLGYALTLRVLQYFAEYGFKDAVLDTDDYRLPAIKGYLRLGFQPLIKDACHSERWKKVLCEIGAI